MNILSTASLFALIFTAASATSSKDPAASTAKENFAKELHGKKLLPALERLNLDTLSAFKLADSLKGIDAVTPGAAVGKHLPTVAHLPDAAVSGAPWDFDPVTGDAAYVQKGLFGKHSIAVLPHGSKKAIDVDLKGIPVDKLLALRLYNQHLYVLGQKKIYVVAFGKGKSPVYKVVKDVCWNLDLGAYGKESEKIAMHLNLDWSPAPLVENTVWARDGFNWVTNPSKGIFRLWWAQVNRTDHTLTLHRALVQEGGKCFDISHDEGEEQTWKLPKDLTVERVQVNKLGIVEVVGTVKGEVCVLTFAGKLHLFAQNLKKEAGYEEPADKFPVAK